VPRNSNAPRRRGQSASVDSSEESFREVPSCERQRDVRQQGVRRHNIKNGRTQAEIRCKPSGVLLQKQGRSSVWDSLTDLPKIMKLRELGKDDEKEVQKIVPHLLTSIVNPARSRQYTTSEIANGQRCILTTCFSNSLTRCT